MLRRGQRAAATYVAVDLGAGSGRVVRGSFGEELQFDVLHRFDNLPRVRDGHERWDVAALFAGIEEGLRRVGEAAVSVGVDGWGVDYGLFDAAGRLLEDPICYRDPRTDGVVDDVLAIVPRRELFARTGIQVQPFNTVYQLFAHLRSGDWPERADRLLMMPDVMHQRLCGELRSERTNASTTQLLASATGVWDTDLLARLGLPATILPPLVEAGTTVGRLRPGLAARLGCPRLRVVAPATHDTASAVAATPLDDGQAFLSSGTWSLLGVETPDPLLSDAAAEHNLTNEAGVEGRNRLLRNIMGLWILESCRRQWEAAGDRADHDRICADLDRAAPFAGFVQPDDPRFFRPGDMVGAVRDYLAETGQDPPSDRPTLSRVILESLALRYAAALEGIERVSGTEVAAIRVVGGGSRNAFLDQATANATGRPVLAGPVEATALGNLVVQAIADGRFADLGEARAYLRARIPVRRFLPRDAGPWRAARARYAEITGEG